VLLLLSWQAGWVLMWALLAAMVVLAACCCFQAASQALACAHVMSGG
jgi:hypothetical protein